MSHRRPLNSPEQFKPIDPKLLKDIARDRYYPNKPMWAMKALENDMKTIHDLANSSDPDAWKEVRFYVAFVEEGVALLLQSFFKPDEKMHFESVFKKKIVESFHTVIPKLPLELMSEVEQLMVRVDRIDIKRLGSAATLESSSGSQSSSHIAATTLAVGTALGSLWHSPVQDSQDESHSSVDSSRE